MEKGVSSNAPCFWISFVSLSVWDYLFTHHGLNLSSLPTQPEHILEAKCLLPLFPNRISIPLNGIKIIVKGENNGWNTHPWQCKTVKYQKIFEAVALKSLSCSTARKTIIPRSWNIIESSKRPCKYHLSINFLTEKKTLFPIPEKFKTRTFQWSVNIIFPSTFWLKKRPYFPFPKRLKQELFSNH